MPIDPCAVCHSAPCACHRLESLAMELLVELGLSDWNDETQTEDVDSSKVTDVLAAFDSVRAVAPSQEPSPVEAGFAAGRASAKAEQAAAEPCSCDEAKAWKSRALCAELRLADARKAIQILADRFGVTLQIDSEGNVLGYTEHG